MLAALFRKILRLSKSRPEKPPPRHAVLPELQKPVIRRPAENPAPQTADWNGNPEATLALKVLKSSNKPLFLTGNAGTGKTTLLKSWNSHARHVVLAPTGIAALQAEGQTIHSFFGFKPELLKPESVASMAPPRRQSLSRLSTLVIDEISMVRADLMGAIEARLRQYGPHPGEVFGGVRIVLIGDLLQLPPVVSDGLEDYFTSNKSGKGYQSPWFFEPTRIKSWPDLRVIELKKPYRQKDPQFIDLLQKVRIGEIYTEDIAYLANHVREAPPHVLRLMSTNAQADSWNENRLSELPGRAHCFRAEMQGEPSELKRVKWPAPDPLWLKQGARVVFVRNDQEQKRWVNGDTGTIEKISADHVHVRIDRDTEALYVVTKHTWRILRYEFDSISNDWEPREIASFSQLPLNLGWARTIHKSQGQSYEHAHIDLGNGAFAPGMSYVALSRVRSSAGLSLAHPIRSSDISVDRHALNWLKERQPGGG